LWLVCGEAPINQKRSERDECGDEAEEGVFEGKRAANPGLEEGEAVEDE
jgi:hypothetical protein